MTRFLTIWIGAALAALSAAAVPEYWPIDLGTLGGTQSAALGLNDAGQVVGWSLTAGGRTQAFVWAGGTLSGLTNLPGGSNGIATAINRHGDITGYSDVSATNHHAFLYASNHLTDLGTFGGPLSAGYAINDNREITGWAYLPPDTNIWLQAFWWRTNQLVAIPPFRGFVHSCEGYGINDSSFICGTTFLYSPHGHNWAYVWYDQNTNAIADEGEMTPLGSLGVYASYGDYSEAKAINNLGQIVGWTGVSNNWSPKHAFLITPSNGTWKLPNDSWENGYLDPTNLLMRDLGTLDRPTDNSFANAINDRSWIVGTSTTGSGTNQAFLWRDGVMTNLNDLIDAGSGWVLTNAAAINEYNEIAGSGLYYGQPRAFLLRSSSGLSVLGTNGAPVVDSEPPSLAKGTDFGEVLIGQARTNTFILRNLGSSNLHVHGWTTNGAGAARFEFAGIPSTVEIGGASNFTAVFWPATAGVFQAALSLDTDSPTPLTNLLFAGTGARHPQTIDFPPIADPFITNVVTLSATAGSGLPVTFEVLMGPASITNVTQLAFTSTGRVAVAASQPGDANWNPAASVTNEFEVWGLYLLTVATAHGDSTPPAGLFTNLLGTVLTNSIAVPEPMGGTQLVCTGWTLTTHDPAEGTTTNFILTVTNHAALTWLWTTNFWLETEAAPHGSVQPDSSWQPAREPALLTATPDRYYHFLHWTNSASGTNNPFALIMDMPKSTRAVFAENLAIHDTPEWWLAEHGWTNDFDAAALADDEPDGFPTWQEYVADTDPTNALSYPRIDWIEAVGTNPPRILWPASSNRVYQIHWADGDPTAPWSTQQLFLGAAEWTDTNAPPPIRLYRIAPLRP